MKTGLKRKIAIVGGGTAGIMVASRITRELPASQIIIIEPSDRHYYQPLWPLVGAGVFAKEKSVKNEEDLIPRGARFIQDAVKEIAPRENYLTTVKGKKFLMITLSRLPACK